MPKYREYKNYDHKLIEAGVKNFWKNDNTFEKSIETREGKPSFVFYEGPPSANGLPGIHHMLSRTLKDIFCRYKTLQGFQVMRKAGWDTHGLPVEISVEKSLGITKEDIGSKISVEDYNNACRKDVLKFKDHWDKLTEDMGYWVNLDDPYITFESKYMESVWWLLRQLYDKGLLYKGYTIQPYSPAAGTGLSTHELNQPGCYRNVKDTSAIAQFKITRNEASEFIFKNTDTDVYFLAWTTTPWTLPSNTALAVGKKINYKLIKTFNPYTGLPVSVILGSELVAKYFPGENAALPFSAYKKGDKNIPYEILMSVSGKELAGMRYEQLMPFAQPTDGDSFKVVTGDFVTTEEGTGIVHIAPSFGADDMKVARENNLGSLTLVNKKGQFTEEMGEFAGRYVKQEYAADIDPQRNENVDVDIVVKLKLENKLFKTEKFEHAYPHCWRTDKPILYYPLDSWFIRTTAMKDRLIELNRTINWQPASTGLGRFENWLVNLVDWNLSRSRYWGTPLPIWRSEEGEEKCMGSMEELKTEIDQSVKAGFMKSNPLADFKPGNFSEDNYHKIDLHRPYVDEIVLTSSTGKPMQREPDLIDVWFDSGSMPVAQFHYPFENQDKENYFPADYISEGVDQTRGWFFTLHAIATMVFDSVAYKNCLSHGLVLDSKGNKMSKRLGNAVDPFVVMGKYGADSTRWYIITNGQPWDNLKFDLKGVDEVRRRFFGTLYNTYSFFALYANIDKFSFSEKIIPVAQRPELDRWIMSELNTLIKSCHDLYEDYEPSRAGRAIQDFVIEYLSNWYVRLSRRKFWKGEYDQDKISAYQTLYQCLETVAKLMSPIAPFFSERLFKDLNDATSRSEVSSIHLTDFPLYDVQVVDRDLEERMQLAQKASSLILSLRKKENIRVRQPLNKVMIPVLDKHFEKQIGLVEGLILSETNVKSLELIQGTDNIIKKKIKPDFKVLGPKYGKLMKQVSAFIMQLDENAIHHLEEKGSINTILEGESIEIKKDEVEIITEDIQGWLVTSEGNLTVALDVTLTPELRNEGLAREIVNRLQNLRKDKGYDVTDHISLSVKKDSQLDEVLNQYKNYICSETLIDNFELKEQFSTETTDKIEIDKIELTVWIKRM